MGAGFDFLSGSTSSFAVETRRDDLLGSSAGSPSSISFVFRLTMVVGFIVRVVMITSYEYDLRKVGDPKLDPAAAGMAR